MLLLETKLISSLFVIVYNGIYLLYFTNDLFKLFLVFAGKLSLPDGLQWVDMRNKWNFRAG